MPASFSGASGTWVQPAAKCGTSAATSGPTSSAFWVGLGGNSEASQALEQLGTEADCTATGTTRYFAWYELVPAPSHQIKMVVEPGDRIAASVNVSGSEVTLTLKNVTRGTSFAHVFTKQNLDTGSAEWIAEAPSLCSGSDCRETALTDFGKVAFSQASATVDGHTGTISDPAWTTTALQLVSGSGHFGHFASEAAPSQATPSGLTSGGQELLRQVEPRPEPGLRRLPGQRGLRRWRLRRRGVRQPLRLLTPAPRRFSRSERQFPGGEPLCHSSPTD